MNRNFIRPMEILTITRANRKHGASMTLYFNTNIPSMTAQRALVGNSFALSKSMEKLSTGYRINRASDDPAGLQVSELLRAQIRGGQKALENTQDGINVLNIVDGTYEGMSDILQRMRELTVTAASDVNGVQQRTAIKTELDQLSDEIDRLADITIFNGRYLLNDAIPSANYVLQVGSNGTSNDTVDIGSVFVNSLNDALGIDFANLSVNSVTNAHMTLNHIDTAIGTIVSRRASIGAFINRLEATTANLQVSVENQQATESRIRNVDVASESAKMVSEQILQQAASNIIAQANQSPAIALSLLRQ